MADLRSRNAFKSLPQRNSLISIFDGFSSGLDGFLSGFFDVSVSFDDSGFGERHTERLGLVLPVRGELPCDVKSVFADFSP